MTLELTLRQNSIYIVFWYAVEAVDQVGHIAKMEEMAL